MIPETTISRLLSVLTVMTFLIAASTDANAQNPRRGYCVGVAGQGTDMWTQAMSGLRPFTPHRDDCNATTEVFVKIYTNSNSVDFGFCMYEEEHTAGALEFEDARQKCLDDGTRLREPAEFKVACQIGTGFSNITDDYEWVGNFPFYAQKTYSAYQQNIASYFMGSGSCTATVAAPLARSDSVSSTTVFGCVR